MGAGYNGCFGSTIGERYKTGNPIPITTKTLEMALNPNYYIDFTVKKYRINLKGSRKKILIAYDSKMPLNIFGKVFKNEPNIIYIGPSALSSEEELANTIAHELNHCRSYLKGFSAPEAPAYKSGNQLSKYIKGEI